MTIEQTIRTRVQERFSTARVDEVTIQDECVYVSINNVMFCAEYDLMNSTLTLDFATCDDTCNDIEDIESINNVSEFQIVLQDVND
jgi:hypothetical protein